MLLWLLHTFQFHLPWLRVFQYITFRAIISCLTAFSISLFFSPKFIARLQRLQIGQVVRNDGPQSHLKKQAHRRWVV